MSLPTKEFYKLLMEDNIKPAKAKLLEWYLRCNHGTRPLHPK